jgi:hypothetical protein
LGGLPGIFIFSHQAAIEDLLLPKNLTLFLTPAYSAQPTILNNLPLFLAASNLYLLAWQLYMRKNLLTEGSVYRNTILLWG